MAICCIALSFALDTDTIRSTLPRGLYSAVMILYFLLLILFALTFLIKETEIMKKQYDMSKTEDAREAYAEYKKWCEDNDYLFGTFEEFVNTYEYMKKEGLLK